LFKHGIPGSIVVMHLRGQFDSDSGNDRKVTIMKIDKARKETARELVNNGISILRPAYDAKRGMWKINKISFTALSHGWRRFGCKWYFTEADCNESIDRICDFEPNKCIREAYVL